MRPALLVIDLQRGYFHEPQSRDRLAERLAAANRLLAGFAERRLPVIMVRTVHKADRSTWTLRMLAEDRPAMIEGSADAQDVEGLHVPDAAQSLVKTRRSAFLRTDLAERLRDLAVDRLVLAGTALEACVTDSARDGVEHDLPVTIARDATVVIDPAAGEERLAFVCEEFGVRFVRVDDILAELDRAGA